MDNQQDRPPGRLRAAARGLAAAAARARPDLTPLRHSADFRRLYAGQAASFAGTMITYVAEPFQAYQLTRSSLMVGLLSVAELVPLVLAALLGGALADAMDRRRMILVTEACGLIIALGLAANAAAWHQVWVLFVLSAVRAGCAGLQRPSLEALVPLLAAHEDLPAAAALSGLMGTAAQVLGPLLGGTLIAGAGLRSAYLVDAGSCLVALVMFARLRSFPPAPEADRPSLRGIAEGLRYVRGRPEILGTYLIDIAAMFFGAPFALFPAYAARVGGPAVLGLLYAAPGCGALLISATSGLGPARAPARPGHRAGRLRLGPGHRRVRPGAGPVVGCRRARGGRRGRHDQRHLPDDHVEPDHSRPAARSPGRAGDDQLHHGRAAGQPGVRAGRRADRLDPAGHRVRRRGVPGRRGGGHRRAAHAVALRLENAAK